MQWEWRVVGVIIAIQGCLLMIAIIGTDIYHWKKDSPPRRIVDFLLGPSEILFHLSAAYVTFYVIATMVIQSGNVLTVWEDKPAVTRKLVQDLIPLMLIALLVAIALFLQVTVWGRCPYCKRFPVRKQIDRSTGTGTWSCRWHPEEHTGTIGIHW